jgi:mono/diheme cytochrome c family protein
MKNNIKKLLPVPLIIVISLFISNIAFGDNPAQAKGNAEEGAKLFKQNCAVCHSIGSNKITGPGLEGVTTRVPQPYQDWMLKWIKNNAALRKSGDAYANKVFADNSSTTMTVFEGALNDDQINNIIAYVANPPKETATAAGKVSGEGAAAPSGEEQGLSTGWLLAIIIAVLLILITVLRTARKSLQYIVNEKQGKPAPEDLTILQETRRWILSHKLAFACIFIFLFSVFCVYGWDYLWDIHITPGYHPSQPINFMHKVHAGENGIACIYCHSGAEKGKVAGIPTLNVCMNCHKGIQGSNPEYQKEIAKIYDAVGWDPQKGDYSKTPHPVKWNRVHSLSDFAFFSHAQHVMVGKIECQKCHGPVETYTTDQQFAPITMGWCVNCHRETPVQMAGNGYYTKIHEAIMQTFHDTSKHPTEADMGGLECGKCHY